MLVLSRDFGVTWDEKTHQLYGERVYRFLSQGLDDDWFRPGGIFIYLHGGLFDTVCVAVQQVLTGDQFVVRHYVSAAFGWLGILYVGRLGRLLARPGDRPPRHGPARGVAPVSGPRHEQPQGRPAGRTAGGGALLPDAARAALPVPRLPGRRAARAVGRPRGQRAGRGPPVPGLSLDGSDRPADRRARAVGFAPFGYVRPLGGRGRRRAAARNGLLAVGPGPPAHAPAAGDDEAVAVPVGVPGPVRRGRRAGERAAVGLHSTLGLAHDASGRTAGRGAVADLARTAAGVGRRSGRGCSVTVARGRPVVRGALPRRLHPGEWGHDLRRHPALAVYVPALRRSRRLRLAAASRRPLEPAAARRGRRARARPRRARALPVAQPSEPGRLLQRRRRRPARRLRPLRARLLGKQPAPGCRVGGPRGARRGNARRGLRPALSTSSATTAGASLRSTSRARRTAFRTWRSCCCAVAARTCWSSPAAATSCTRSPRPTGRHCRSWCRGRATPKSRACCGSARRARCPTAQATRAAPARS